jgi:hypothetical protein
MSHKGETWDEAQDRLYRERHNLETAVVRAAKLYGMWGLTPASAYSRGKFKYWEEQLLARAVKLAVACRAPAEARKRRRSK